VQSPIRVQTPDGKIAEFPAGTDPAVIESALRAQFPSSSTVGGSANVAPAPNIAEQSADAALRFGRRIVSNAAPHPIDAVMGLLKAPGQAVTAPAEEFQKAKEAYNKGDWKSALHALAAITPGLGPIADDLSTRATSGQAPEALADATTLAVSSMLPEASPTVIKALDKGSVAPIADAMRTALEERAAGKSQRAIQSSIGDVLNAIPPSKSAPYDPATLTKASPYLAAEHARNPITSVETLRDAGDSAITQIEEHVNGYIQQHPDDLIETNPLASARSLLARGARDTDVAKGMKALEGLGLDKPMTVAQADAVRLRLNNENRAFLKKNNYDLAAARAADPAFAAKEAAAESLRDGVYNKLEARGITGVRELRQDEGALIKIRNAAERQIYSGEKAVAGTGDNGPLRKMAALAVRSTPLPAVITDPAAAMIAKPNLSRDALIERAFKNIKGQPDFPTVPDVQQPAGALGAGARPMPGADSSFVRGVPAVPTGAFNPPRLLPPGQSRAIPLPASPDVSGVSAVPARGIIIRDPVTGRFKRIFTGESQ